MKLLYFILIITIVTCCISCKGDNDPDFDCPSSNPLKSTGVILLSYNDYLNYNSFPVIDNVEHHTSYETKWGLAYFSLFTRIYNICPGEPLKVKAYLKIANSDNKLTDSLLITELVDNTVVKSTLNNLPPDGNGTIYSVEVPHLFNVSQSNNVLFGHCAVFPSLGTYPLDSAYFFDKFIELRMSSTYKNR